MVVHRKPYRSPSSRTGRHRSIARVLASGIQRYIFRICFKGLLVWNCPYCGHFNTSRISNWTWRVRCNGQSRADESMGIKPHDAEDRTHRVGDCGHWFIYFIGLIPIPPGRCVRPGDTIPVNGLVERMPLGEFIRAPRWMSGEGVNRVVDYPEHPAFCCLHNVMGECRVGEDEKRD